MSVRVERDGPVTTVILDRPAVRNAVDRRGRILFRIFFSCLGTFLNLVDVAGHQAVSLSVDIGRRLR